MDLNTLFFMRPSLHGMVYPAFAPREFLLLRGKLPPVSPTAQPLQPAHSHYPTGLSMHHHHHHHPASRLSPISPVATAASGGELSPAARKHASSPLSPPPPPTPSHSTPRAHTDQYGPIKRLAEVQPPRNPTKPLTSFSIADILESSSPPPGVKGLAVSAGGKVVRPWGEEDMDSGEESSDDNDEDEEINVDEELLPVTKKGVSPLDALFKMTSKTFDGQNPNGGHSADPSGRDHLSLFTKSQPPKKRRKSRTAFTNQQIYELEKRFLYQKYLTPADKEEIAQSLGLSNAQVITWFQNRRAKLKRDLEELKADVTAAKIVGSGEEEEISQPPTFTSLEELQLYNKNALKKVAASHHQAAALLEEASRDSHEESTELHDDIPETPSPRPSLQQLQPEPSSLEEQQHHKAQQLQQIQQ